MKLGTLPGTTKDGRLVVVSKDLTRATEAQSIIGSLREAVESWNEVEADLLTLSDDLERGRVESFAFDTSAALAPLPRAWQWLDGSTFRSHAELMEAVFKHKTDPRDMLMYQGVSHQFFSACEDIPFNSEEDGIDFEGEFGVITGEVPMGASVEQAAQSIRLLVQINDWSLRVQAQREIKIAFGWIHAKPPCSLAPVAVTPDELGPDWRDGRVHLPLYVDWNGERFGAAHGGAMEVSFPEMIAYAARSRMLCAGTVFGSGTVSNANFREVGSSCIAERRGIEVLDTGSVKTGFMRFGDRLRMEARMADDTPLFGAIDQKIVQV
ncbi:fumarylacetoacetate hydrolase family protein [Aquisediminimonas profunda]|uniref:fumarylacetoacetate hydrolase family protein n=1 Tax=Aquisediminimonas profunda TaxID=1550733 RepID=UPI001C632A3D|nr:fumarylacetoacetate hydrolase family protein [Aquisediminimonas profunda]